MCGGQLPSGQCVISPDWPAIDAELRCYLSDLHFSLGHNFQDLNLIVDGFAMILGEL